MCSGCQSRRHSSPAVGFWVQRRLTPRKWLETQMLQPMHSRMSSMRPSSILRGRNGIRDRGTGRSDHVEHAAADERCHGVRRGEAAHPHHRPGGHRLDEVETGLVDVLGRESRGRGIVLPGARDDVPEVGQLGEALDDLPPVLVGDEARPAEELLDDDAHRDRALPPGRLPSDLDELAQQPGPVLQAASVLVVAPGSGARAGGRRRRRTDRSR